MVFREGHDTRVLLSWETLIYMSKRTATPKELEELHALMAKTLAQLIREDPTASTLNVARQFLKDNGIEANVVEGNSMHNLVEGLPFVGLKVVNKE